MNPLRYYSPAVTPLHQTITCDLCIYGGTSGGMAAAVTARRKGLRVVVLEPTPYIGGMTSGGLSLTDIGNKKAIGGVSREFYRRAGSYYRVDEHWRFEPKVADRVFQDWIREEQIEVFINSFLSRVEMKDNKIITLWTENGIEVSARMFMDCSYEGDLMAAAKVSFTVGRESNSQYQETLNGAQVRDQHQFELPVDPYVKEGDPSSGLLPGIEAEEPVHGQGDHRLQAYNFRLCLSKDPANQIPFTQPEDYDRSRYEILARYCRAGYVPRFTKFDPLINDKVDMNNHGAFSSDYIGYNHGFVDASYAGREEIFQAHVSHIKGLLWFWKQDVDVPKAFQEPFQKWGWAADEFVECGGFSRSLYVREGRRLVGDVVMTEHHCRGQVTVDDPVALTAYPMDSHNCRRFAKDGRIWNEGDVQVHSGPPYPISYRSLIPKRGECTNLLIPFCLSASHIAFGSIRMEPVFMILAESCVHAAVLAMKHHLSVQEVPYPELRQDLLKAGQVLGYIAKAENIQSGE
jgi:hypothetical protein